MSLGKIHYFLAAVLEERASFSSVSLKLQMLFDIIGKDHDSNNKHHIVLVKTSSM